MRENGDSDAKTWELRGMHEKKGDEIGFSEEWSLRKSLSIILVKHARTALQKRISLKSKWHWSPYRGGSPTRRETGVLRLPRVKKRSRRTGVGRRKSESSGRRINWYEKRSCDLSNKLLKMKANSNRIAAAPTERRLEGREGEETSKRAKGKAKGPTTAEKWALSILLAPR